jgi:hypothetical protein
MFPFLPPSSRADALDKKFFSDMKVSPSSFKGLPLPLQAPPAASGFFPLPPPPRPPAHLTQNLAAFSAGDNYALSTLHRISELARQSKTNDKQRQFEVPFGAKQRETAVSDIFRCVWCHERYGSLADLTQHLKEANHTSVPGTTPPPPRPPPLGPAKNVEAQNNRSYAGGQNGNGGGNAQRRPKEDKDSSSVTVPRKLVRGQDVWLGKGQEQTRQILKCMWCGESFKSLADMTVHMTETQHYTKVISQEQLSSWKASAAAASSSPPPPPSAMGAAAATEESVGRKSPLDEQVRKTMT